MGCSRQEYWNGLPFPTSGEPQRDNTIHSSEKFKSFFEKEENSTKKNHGKQLEWDVKWYNHFGTNFDNT